MVLRDYVVLGDGKFFGESGFQLRENVGQLEHHMVVRQASEKIREARRRLKEFVRHHALDQLSG